MILFLAGAMSRSTQRHCYARNWPKLWSYLNEKREIEKIPNNNKSKILVDSGAHSWNKMGLNRIGNASLQTNLPDPRLFLNAYIEFIYENRMKPWNFIERNGSAGVLAVRELEIDGTLFYEVMDGNHRIDALDILNWGSVRVENFGVISKAEAITLARRRTEWFDTDELAYAELLAKDVVPEIDVELLASFMPQSQQEIIDQMNLLDFNWEAFDPDGKKLEEAEALADDKEEDQPESVSNAETDYKDIHLRVPNEVYIEWLRWRKRCEELLGYSSDFKAFEFAVVEANNLPDESLSK